MIFSAAGAKFEDCTIKLGMVITETSRDVNQDDYKAWLEIKPQTAFGYLPILEVKTPDGQTATISETLAICKELFIFPFSFINRLYWLNM